MDQPGLEFHVFPAQSERFASTHASECEEPEDDLETVAPDLSEEQIEFLGGPEAFFVLSVIDLSHVGESRYVAEDSTFWTAFLRSLKARGLTGVRLVISDAHEGLKKAIGKCFQGTSWQR